MIRALMATLALVLAVAVPVARAEVTIREVTSPKGATAWLVEDHGIPFVALHLRFGGGASGDLPGKEGATVLMTALLEEGAGELDAQGFAAARDALAAEFRFSADMDGVTVRARFLSENRDAALALLRQALVAPRFDADALERVLGQVLANLRSAEKDPGQIAGRAIRARMFPGHPYGRPADGTIASVQALTREDVVAAWRAALVRGRVTVGAAGDLTEAGLGAMIDGLLEGLPEEGAPLPPRAEANAGGGLAVTPFPGPQAVVAFAAPGIRFDDPDYFAAVVMNEILGGERFGSRLMTALREERGLTYGVRVNLAALDRGEMISGSFATGTGTAAEAVEVLRAEWARMAAEGVSEAELDAAKTYLTGAYPLRFDGNGQIAGMLAGMQVLGLTPDYPRTRNDRVRAVTRADVARVARRLLDPARLSVVVVGEGTGLATGD